MSTTPPAQPAPPAQHEIAAIDEHPLREMLKVALPAVLTMSSVTMMAFVDKLFVSRISPEALAAAGNGGIAAFFPMSIVMGFTGIINTFVSQNLGAGKPERGPAYAWNGLWIVLGVWLFVLLPYAAFLPQAMHLMRTVFGLQEVPAEVAHLEVVYGRIMLAAGVFIIGSRALHSYFYGMHRPLVVTVSVIIGQVVNILLTWALVFGKFGFPQWGVAGSAVGTAIGAMCEFALPLIVFLSRRFSVYGTRTSWRPDLSQIKDLGRLGWPAGAQFGNEMVCWWVFMAGLSASFGPNHNAAGWITLQYMHLSFMPAVGLSIALTAIVGKCVGAGRYDLAVTRTWLGMKVAMIYMGACALVFVVFRHQLIGIFAADSWTPQQTEEIVRIGSRLLILAAVFQLFDAMGMSLFGALRGAGDTIWPSIATMTLSWSCIIGLGWALVKWAPGLGSTGPWIAAALYIILLGIALCWRFLGGGWKTKRLVKDHEPELTASGSVAALAGPLSVGEEAGIGAAEGEIALGTSRA